MKVSDKFILFCLLGGVFFLDTLPCFAQKQEDIFIPDGAFKNNIKLPPIQAGNYEKNGTVKKASKPSPQNNTYRLPSAQRASAPNSPQQTDASVNAPQSNASQALEAHEKPDYKEKYDDYLDDLKVIAKTGKAPKNAQLEKDLSQMNSDETFVVE